MVLFLFVLVSCAVD